MKNLPKETDSWRVGANRDSNARAHRTVGASRGADARAGHGKRPLAKPDRHRMRPWPYPAKYLLLQRPCWNRLFPCLPIQRNTPSPMMDKCRTRQEIAKEYGIDRKTLTNLLKRHQIELPPGLVTPEWAERVYAALGRPEKSPPPRDRPLMPHSVPKIPQLSPKFHKIPHFFRLRYP